MRVVLRGLLDLAAAFAPQGTTSIAGTAVPMVSIDGLLARADIISLHLGLNDATRGFLDRARLKKTKPGVIIVNTARAGVVDVVAVGGKGAAVEDGL